MGRNYLPQSVKKKRLLAQLCDLQLFANPVDHHLISNLGDR
ncbi:hypothetical protein [Streptococcus equi]|nr:hypothetical protein [Streptococcus equi]